jgi:hypothetical protein
LKSVDTRCALVSTRLDAGRSSGPDDLVDAPFASRGARKATGMNDADERRRDAERDLITPCASIA